MDSVTVLLRNLICNGTTGGVHPYILLILLCLIIIVDGSINLINNTASAIQKHVKLVIVRMGLYVGFLTIMSVYAILKYNIPLYLQ